MNTLTRILAGSLVFLFGAALVAAPPSAVAQNEPGELYLGVQGGLTQSQLAGDGVDASSRQGFSGGVNFMYHVNEVFSVELGALYTKRGADGVTVTGASNKSSPAFDYDDDEVAINYYDFPLLLKLTAPVEPVKVRLLAGPALSFLQSAKENDFNTQRSIESTPDVESRFLLYDLAGVVGGEIGMPLPGLTNGEVAVDGRYSFGFDNIDQTQGYELKNRSLSGSLILRFAL
ncbi:MAG: porin family protein [Salinibacter sp.]